jgi:uncharacterized protein
MKQETAAFETERETSSHEARQPFVLKFKTDQHNYIYDVNLNQVVAVEPLVYELVHEYGVLSQQQMVEQYQHLYSRAEIENAYRAIDRFHETHGFFSSPRLKRIQFPHDAQSLRESYEDSLTNMTLGVTEQCNLRCGYCGYSGLYPELRQHSPNHMSFDTARKALDFLKTRSRASEMIYIGFYGGEPLVESLLIKKCITYAEDIFDRKLVSFRITTNGTLLSGDICEFLVAHDVTITVSLDGPKELHDRYRRDIAGRGTFDRVYQNLVALRQAHPEFYRNNIEFNCVMAPPYDYEETDRFIENSPLFESNVVRCLYVEPYGTTFYDQFTPAQLSGDGFERLYKKWLQNPVFYGSVEDKASKIVRSMRLNGLTAHIQGLIPVNELFATHYPSGLCVPGTKRCFVDYGGRIFVCEKVPTTTDLACLGTVDQGIDPEKVMTMIESCIAASKGCDSCVACRSCKLCFIHGISLSKYDAVQKRRLCEQQTNLLRDMFVKTMEIYEINPHAFDALRHFVPLEFSAKSGERR